MLAPGSASFRRIGGLRMLSVGFVVVAATGWASRAYSQTAPPPPTAATPAAKADPKKPPVVLSEDNEVRIGRENAEENDKHVTLVTDAKLVERVNRIGQDLAVIANTVPIPAKWGSPQLKKFNYTFKIVDDKDVNAYSLPGGYIYVNKGLLDYVHSDDELAGVLAHEITHASHHHMVKLQREQNKIQNILIPLLAGVLIATKAQANDIGNAVNGAYLYMTAKSNTYGVEAEKDADNGAILLLTHTHYNPTGLYSFMLRLAADERNRTYGDLGIFRTHPPGNERAASAKELLTELKLPIQLSAVDPTLLVSITVYKAIGTKPEVAELKWHGVTLCRIYPAESQTAEQRAQKVAKGFNTLIDNSLQPYEVRASRDGTKVLARSVVILTEADAKAQDKTIAALAKEVADAVMQVTQRRQLDNSL
jgi:predicted Zn-dependent protease